MALTGSRPRRSLPLGVAAYLAGYAMTVVAVSGRVRAGLAIEVTGDFVPSATLAEILGAAPPP